MRAQKPGVLTEENNIALSELQEQIRLLFPEQYDHRPLHAVIALIFSQFAVLEAEIDSLAATLIESRKDKMVDIRDERRVFHLRHWARILRQMADRKEEFEVAQFLFRLPPVD